MIAFDIEGIVDSVGETRTHQFADGTRHSRELVIREPEPPEGSRYPPALLCVMFWGERTEELDRLSPNDTVTVRLSAKSIRKEGKDKETGEPFGYWTTRLSGIRVNVVEGAGGTGGRTQGAPTPAGAAAGGAAWTEPPVPASLEEDVPF